MSFGSSGKKSVTQQSQQAVSQVREPAPTPENPNQAALRRAGRASLLISTTPQGVLGAATTGRRQLLAQ